MLMWWVLVASNIVPPFTVSRDAASSYEVYKENVRSIPVFLYLIALLFRYSYVALYFAIVTTLIYII